VTEPARMHPADLEMLADLLAERLADRVLSAVLRDLLPLHPAERGDGRDSGPDARESVADAAPRLLDAREVARMLGVRADWVREHADDLGVVRVGRRLRFDPDRVAGALAARNDSNTPRDDELAAPAARSRRRRPRSRPTSGDLLPIRPIVNRTEKQ
jgi:hypothetical protein